MSPAALAVLTSLGCVGSTVTERGREIASVWICPAAPAAPTEEGTGSFPERPKLGGPMPWAPNPNRPRRG